MRITMFIVLTEQQHAPLPHEINDPGIGFENALAGKVFYLSCKASRIIDGTINLEPIFLSDYKVVMAMTGGRMHTAGAGFGSCLFGARVFHVQFNFRVRFASQGNVLTQHHERWAVEPCVTTL